MGLQDCATAFYGKSPLNQSQTRPRIPRIQIGDLNPNMDGQTILFRARVHTSRAQGNKMVFLNLRQQIHSVQALLEVTPEKVSKQMVKWTAGLAMESIVLVEGVVQKSPEPIKSASVSDVEVRVSQVCKTISSWTAYSDRSRSTLSRDSKSVYRSRSMMRIDQKQKSTVLNSS